MAPGPPPHPGSYFPLTFISVPADPLIWAFPPCPAPGGRNDHFRPRRYAPDGPRPALRRGVPAACPAPPPHAPPTAVGAVVRTGSVEHPAGSRRHDGTSIRSRPHRHGTP